MNGFEVIGLFATLQSAFVLAMIALGMVGILVYVVIDDAKMSIADKRWIYNANMLNDNIDENEELFEAVGTGLAPGMCLPRKWCVDLHDAGCKKIKGEPTWLVDKVANRVNLVVQDTKQKMFSVTFDKHYNAVNVKAV